MQPDEDEQPPDEDEQLPDETIDAAPDVDVPSDEVRIRTEPTIEERAHRSRMSEVEARRQRNKDKKLNNRRKGNASSLQAAAASAAAGTEMVQFGGEMGGKEESKNNDNEGVLMQGDPEVWDDEMYQDL